MSWKKALPLTDEEIWDLLQRCLDDVGETKGETDFGDKTLDMTRTLLLSMQKTLIYKMDGLLPDDFGKKPFRSVTLALFPEMEESLRAYALDHHPRKDIVEVIAHIIGLHMAQMGYFKNPGK